MAELFGLSGKTLRPDFDPLAKGVIVANDTIKKNYGAILGHLQPVLSGYDRVFVISEKEISGFVGYEKKTPENDRTLTGLLDHLFPGRGAGASVAYPPNQEKGIFGAAIKEQTQASSLGDETTGSSEKDYLFVSILINNARDQLANTDSYAAASSLGSSNTPRPFKVGFLMLPEKMTITPENLMHSVPKESHRVKNLDPEDQEQRQNDTAATVIAHEIGHLVYSLEENRPIIHNSSARPRSQADIFGDELFADRMMLKWLPGLIEAGLVSDPEIGEDFVAARKIESFINLTKYSRQKSSTDNHSMGFEVETNTPHKEAYSRFYRDTKSLREQMTLQAEGMCDAAARGTGDPSFVKRYQDTDNLLKWASQTNRDSKNPSPRVGVLSDFFDEIKRKWRNDVLCLRTHNDFNHLDPIQLRLTEGLDPSKIGPGGQRILREYQEAVDRMLLGNPDLFDDSLESLIKDYPIPPSAPSESPQNSNLTK